MNLAVSTMLVMALFLHGPFAFADKDDDDVQSAIQETQKTLTNRDERAKLYKNDAAAKGANSFASDAVGGDNEKMDEIYAISAELIPFLAKEANGDPAVMMKILDEAKTNPKKFFDRFPAAQQEKVKKLVESIDKGKKNSHP